MASPGLIHGPPGSQPIDRSLGFLRLQLYHAFCRARLCVCGIIRPLFIPLSFPSNGIVLKAGNVHVLVIA